MSRVGIDKGTPVPTLYHPITVMVVGLALLAIVLGLLAAALGDAAAAGDSFWIGLFLALLFVGLGIFTYVTVGLSTYVADRPVDLSVDDEVYFRYDDSRHDHHSGEC